MKVEVMLWMLVLASVALAIASTKYRLQSLLAGGVVIVAIVATVILAKRGEAPASTLVTIAPAPLQQPKHIDFERFHMDNLDKNDPEAKNRIAATDIRFDQIRAEAGSQLGTIESIAARLYNDSHYTLTDYGYYLVVKDCVKAACIVIYDQRGWAPATVPANQARDIIIVIRDGDTRGVPTFKITGTANITLLPTETRSYQSVQAPGA